MAGVGESHDSPTPAFLGVTESQALVAAFRAFPGTIAYPTLIPNPRSITLPCRRCDRITPLVDSTNTPYHRLCKYVSLGLDPVDA